MIYKAKLLKNMSNRSLNNYSNKLSLKNHLTFNNKLSNFDNPLSKKRNNKLKTIFPNKLSSRRLKFSRLYRSKKFRYNKFKSALLLY